MEKINGIIYKITSPSDKIYIGQTTRPVEERFNEYKLLKCKDQKLIYESLLKHGVENHKFEIIKDNIGCKTALIFYEKLFIKLFNSYENGLN